MISYVPGGIEIPVTGIRNGSITNDDGHGWAVAEGSDLLVGKSMVFQEALEGFLEAREEMGRGSVAMFHSRFGTHGDMGEFNIHPFYLGEDSVMSHNGILPDKYHPTLKDRRSDTRIFVDRIGRFVDNPNGIPSRRGSLQLGRMIGSGNKLTFISVRSGKPKVRIVNANQGVQEGGVWYSNNGFETDYSWYYRSSRAMDQYQWDGKEYVQAGGWPQEGIGGLGWDAYAEEGRKYLDPDQCAECGSDDLDYELGMCETCVSCLDCHDNFAHCMCYRPSGMRSAIERIQTIG